MKALRQSGKRFIGGVLVCAILALPVLTPAAAQAGSSGLTSAHSVTTLHPVPKRCQWIVNEIDSISPADFPNLQAYQTAMRSLLTQLRACEARH